MIKEGLRSCCGSIATLVGLKTSVDELTNQWDCCLFVLEWVVRRGRVYQRSELLLWQHTVVMTHSESNPLSWLAGWRWFGKSETLNKTRPPLLFCRVASLPKGEGSKVSGLKREIWCPPHPVQLRIWTFCLTIVVLLCSLSDSRPTTLCVPMTFLVLICGSLLTSLGVFSRPCLFPTLPGDPSITSCSNSLLELVAGVFGPLCPWTLLWWRDNRHPGPKRKKMHYALVKICGALGKKMCCCNLLAKVLTNPGFKMSSCMIWGLQYLHFPNVMRRLLQPHGLCTKTEVVVASRCEEIVQLSVSNFWC